VKTTRLFFLKKIAKIVEFSPNGSFPRNDASSRRAHALGRRPMIVAPSFVRVSRV